jgi:hypothetical protein
MSRNWETKSRRPRPVVTDNKKAFVINVKELGDQVISDR